MITWSAAAGLADDENACCLCDRPAPGLDRLCRLCAEVEPVAIDPSVAHLGTRIAAKIKHPWAPARPVGGAR